MGERYIIMGTQLGMLQALEDKTERQKVIDEIIDKQFIGESDRSITEDVRSIELLKIQKKNQYACLGCGFVQDDNVIKTRLDRGTSGTGFTGHMGGIKAFHGFIFQRACLKCGHNQFVKEEEDKK